MSVNEGKKAFVAGEALLARTIVKLDTSTGKVVYADASDTRVLGVNEYAVAAGETANVILATFPGTQEVRAAGVITLGADVYLADDGEIQALPEVNGTYLRIGIALEAAEEDQDIISVLLDDCRTLITVST
jgi:hypothetical protein